MGALNVEVMTAIMKTIKEDSEKSNFYFDWAERVPNGYLFSKILEIKGDL
jgi:hypothetical protein